MNKQADIRLLQQNITTPDAHVWIVDRLFSTQPLVLVIEFFF
jgi:hypothetical protein